MRLQDRVAVITGAAGGLGTAIAREFAKAGASLCLADKSNAAELVATLRQGGAKAVECQIDVTKAEEVEALTQKAVSTYGRIDVLVNVAGVSSHGKAADLAEAEWDRVLTNNLKSVFLCIRAVVPAMRAQRYGRIISIGSVLGKNGGNPRPWIDPKEQLRAGNAAYGASKAGINALTYFFAKELAADGITVNVVAPGPIASRMTTNFPATLRGLIPVGRMGQPEDVADAVAFLAGEQAGFITGEVLDVNGGAWCD